TVGLALFLATLWVVGVDFFPDDRTGTDWLVVLSSGVVGIGLADTILFAALNRIGAGRFSIVECVYSPFVVLCSFIYLSEPMTPILFLSMGLMVAAIIIGVWKSGAVGGSSGVSQHRAGVILGVIAIFLTAASVVFVKPLLDRADVWWVSTMRLAGGVVVLLVYTAFSSQRRDVLASLSRASTWRLALPAALVGTYLGYLFWNMGMKYTYTTVASVLNQSSNILILLLSWLVLKEKLGFRQWLAVAMGIGGAVLIIL
ncbi:MAG: DMT family transporter, partial [Deltaproteobacteria bacterium]|nr:DMT family transporter [Deltaproteobacteria bacterium]